MRPSKGTKTGSVWDAADKISKDLGRMAQRREVVSYCETKGWNANTANTQYGHWKRATYPGEVRPQGSSVSELRLQPLPSESRHCRNTDWSELLKNGFSYTSDWSLGGGGELVLDRNAPAEAGVYVFVLDSEIVYVGVTRRTLAARMSDYRRGHVKQRTSARVKALILSSLVDGRNIRVLFALPGYTEWNGFKIEIAPGLEAGLIEKYKPKWNIQGL